MNHKRVERLISYHWVDADGALVVFDGIRTVLPEIGAGAERTIPVAIDRPTHEGPLNLQIGLVQEGVAWFEAVSKNHILELLGSPASESD